MSLVQLHLVGSRTAAQIAAHATILQEATKDGKAPPKSPPLRFFGFSGRAVRLRMLEADERDQVAAVAAKEVGEDAEPSTFAQRRNRDWVYRALVEVTKERELDEAGLATATWLKMTQQQLEGVGPTSGKTLFTAKDMDVLCSWFHSEHLANAADLEAVMGKAVEVVDE